MTRNAWDFAPRRLAAKPSLHPAPAQKPGDQLAQLRAEHPWLSRGVEVMQMGAWVAHDQSRLAPWSQASAALSGVTAVASAAWGINKLVQGQTGLDRVEGLCHVSLAVSYSMASIEQLRPGLAWTNTVGTPANYAAAGFEMMLGAADAYRGWREDDGARKWTGIASLVSGASLAACVAFPGANGLAQALAVMSMATRQSILGRGSD